MTKERAIDLCHAIDQYLCAGNPIWDTAEIHDAMSMAIEALNEEKTGKWIPCSERLPNYGHNMLMCRKDGTVGEGCYHSIIGEWSQFRWNVNGVKDVIAWMPLPEPYKENES